MVECPDCAAEIKIENVEVGEILNCPECGAELEVRSINPVVLELAPQEAEDWGQ